MNSIVLEKVGETCLICEEKHDFGIHIFSHFICQGCERKIVHTETDQEEYRFYLERLRKLNTLQSS